MSRTSTDISSLDCKIVQRLDTALEFLDRKYPLLIEFTIIDF